MLRISEIFAGISRWIYTFSRNLTTFLVFGSEISRNARPANNKFRESNVGSKVDHFWNNREKSKMNLNFSEKLCDILVFGRQITRNLLRAILKLWESGVGPWTPQFSLRKIGVWGSQRWQPGSNFMVCFRRNVENFWNIRENFKMDLHLSRKVTTFLVFGSEISRTARPANKKFRESHVGSSVDHFWNNREKLKRNLNFSERLSEILVFGRQIAGNLLRAILKLWESGVGPLKTSVS